MKKNHIFNQSTGKCFCGISIDNQMIAFDHEGDWFDSSVHPIDQSNYQSVLCINCMKQFDVDLIDKFETDAFLIDYANRLPNGKKAMKFFKCQMRLKRQSIDRSKPTIKKTSKSKSKPTNQSIEKSAKGKARDKRKKTNQSKKANQSQPAKIIAKPNKQLIDKPKNDIIELKDEIKKDKSIKSDKSIDQKITEKESIKEVIETVDPSDNWTIGDPIENDIFELAIGNDWKLVRHNQKLNQWKFVTRQSIKGVPKWIDDSEFIDYQDAAQLIIDGYCE